MSWLKKCLLLLATAVFLIIPASAVADDPSPTVKEKAVYIGRVQLDDKRFPMDHYKLEAKVDDGLSAMGDKALHGLNSGLWSLNKQMASVTVYFVEQLMTFNLLNMIVDEASIMSNRIFTAMSGTFLGLFIVITGGTAAYRFFVSQQVGRAVKAILSSLVILVCISWFFSDVKGNVIWMNNIGADLEGIAGSANVLLTSDEKDNSKPYDQQEGTAILRNQIFNLMVKKPYLFLNYGSTKETDVNKEDPNRVNKLLEVKPFTDEGKSKREDIVSNEVDKLENKNMTTDYSGERFGMLFLTLISNIAVALPVVILSGAKFLVQLFFIAAVIFSAIPLIMALLPTYAETAAKHFRHIMNLIFYKAALVLLIAVMTGITTFVYEGVKVTAGMEGYMLIVFVIVLTMWGFYKYRTQILEVASMGFIQGNQATERMTQSLTNGVSGAAEKGASAAGRMAEQHMRNKKMKDMFSQGGSSKAEGRQSKQAATGQTAQKRSSSRAAAEPNNKSQQQGSGIASERQNSPTAQNKENGVVNLSQYRQSRAGASQSGETPNKSERYKNDGRTETIDMSFNGQSWEASQDKEAQAERFSPTEQQPEIISAARQEVAASQEQEQKQLGYRGNGKPTSPSRSNLRASEGSSTPNKQTAQNREPGRSATAQKEFSNRSSSRSETIRQPKAEDQEAKSVKRMKLQ